MAALFVKTVLRRESPFQIDYLLLLTITRVWDLAYPHAQQPCFRGV